MGWSAKETVGERTRNRACGWGIEVPQARIFFTGVMEHWSGGAMGCPDNQYSNAPMLRPFSEDEDENDDEDDSWLTQPTVKL